MYSENEMLSRNDQRAHFLGAAVEEGRFSSFQERTIVIRSGAQRHEDRGGYMWGIDLLEGQKNREFSIFHSAFAARSWYDIPFGAYFVAIYRDRSGRVCVTGAGKAHLDRSGRENPSAFHLVLETDNAIRFADDLGRNPEGSLLKVFNEVFDIVDNVGGEYHLLGLADRMQVQVARLV